MFFWYPFLVSYLSGLKKPEAYRTATQDRARQLKINAIIIKGERIHSLPPVHTSQNAQVKVSINMGTIRYINAKVIPKVQSIKYANISTGRGRSSNLSPRSASLISCCSICFECSSASIFRPALMASFFKATKLLNFIFKLVSLYLT